MTKNVRTRDEALWSRVKPTNRKRCGQQLIGAQFRISPNA